MAGQVDRLDSLAGVAISSVEATPRAKPLPRAPVSAVRMVERTGGQAFKSAIDAAGSTLAVEARRNGVDDAVFGRIVLGTVPLTHERMRACSPSVRRAYHEAELAVLNEEEGDAPPASCATFVHSTLNAGAKHARVFEVVRDIASDGRIDAHEKPLGRRAIAEAIEALRGADRQLASVPIEEIEREALGSKR